MSDNALEKKVPWAIKEKGQYFLVLGVIASMLVVAQIPIFVVFFFGVFGYLVLKMLSTSSRSETREIFEFYLSANEILRDDDRRWFGFEIADTISRGEGIVRRMSAVPPLVQFALGALYHKAGDHKAAVKHLTSVLERDAGDEAAFVYPTPELRNYVKVLRKIEREPADAPLTSAAVRSLERARKLRGKALLEESRTKFATAFPIPIQVEAKEGVDNRNLAPAQPQPETVHPEAEHHSENGKPYFDSLLAEDDESKNAGRRKDSEKGDRYSDRKPITEVLHDIYDKNVQ